MLTCVNLKAKQYTNNDLFTQSVIAYAPFTYGPVDGKTFYGPSSTKSMTVSAVGGKNTTVFRTFDNTFIEPHALVYSAEGRDKIYNYEAFSADGKTFDVPFGVKGSGQ